MSLTRAEGKKTSDQRFPSGIASSFATRREPVDTCRAGILTGTGEKTQGIFTETARPSSCPCR